MNGETIYNLIKDFSIGERRKYFKTITPEQKIDYDKYNQKIRQKKFYSDPKNKERWNMERRDYKQMKRQEDPAIYREANKRDVKNFRMREQTKEQEIKEKKATEVLANNIKMKLARNKMNILKDEKRKVLKEEAKAERQLKKIKIDQKREANRIYMKEYRAKKNL